MTWPRYAVRRRAARLAGPPTLTCPECGGSGDLVTCVNDGSHGCSHTNDIERTCWLCQGAGSVPVEAAEDHQAMLAADKARQEAPEDPTPWSQGDPWSGTDWSEPPPF